MEWKKEWKRKSWKKNQRNRSNHVTIDQHTNPITIPNEKTMKTDYTFSVNKKKNTETHIFHDNLPLFSNLGKRYNTHQTIMRFEKTIRRIHKPIQHTNRRPFSTYKPAQAPSFDLSFLGQFVQHVLHNFDNIYATIILKKTPITTDRSYESTAHRTRWPSG